MDLLQQTAGNIINSRRRLGGPPLHPAVSSA